MAANGAAVANVLNLHLSLMLQLQNFVKSAAATLIDVAVVNDAAVANVAAAAAISFVVLVNNAAVAVFNAAAVL